MSKIHYPNETVMHKRDIRQTQRGGDEEKEARKDFFESAEALLAEAKANSETEVALITITCKTVEGGEQDGRVRADTQMDVQMSNDYVPAWCQALDLLIEQLHDVDPDSFHEHIGRKLRDLLGIRKSSGRMFVGRIDSAPFEI